MGRFGRLPCPSRRSSRHAAAGMAFPATSMGGALVLLSIGIILFSKAGRLSVPGQHLARPLAAVGSYGDLLNAAAACPQDV